MSNDGSSRIKVIFCGRCIPHYRKKLYEHLQENKNCDIRVYSNPSDKGVETISEDEFASVGGVAAKTFELKIPFRKNWITFQRRVVWAMICGRARVFVMSPDFLRPSVWSNLLLSTVLPGKVCLWGHGFSRPETKLSCVLRKIMFGLAGAVVVYSKKTKDMWVQRGTPKEKIFVAYNTINTEEVFGVKNLLAEDDIERFKAEQGLAGKKIMLFSGRMHERKRPELLLEVLKRICDDVEDAYLVYIGDGYLLDDLKRRALEMRLSDKVRFCGAVYDQETLGKYFLSSRVMVIPAAAGLAVQHAFAYGLPVIIGDDFRTHGPEADIVIDRET